MYFFADFKDAKSELLALRDRFIVTPYGGIQNGGSGVGCGVC
jgi:hypothetical protein